MGRARAQEQPPRPVRAKDALGRYGEDLAARHLITDGFVVLERNWRCDLGELDIVARDGRRARGVRGEDTAQHAATGRPFEAVTERKLHRIERLGLRWMKERGVRPSSMRVDVVSVLRPASGPTVVEHVRGLR